MVGKDRRDKALTYLAETDSAIADAKAAVSLEGYKLKILQRKLELLSSNKTVRDRESEAMTDPDYQAQMEKEVETIRHYEHLRAKRETERIVWETWRTEESSRRHGGAPS